MSKSNNKDLLKSLKSDSSTEDGELTTSIIVNSEASKDFNIFSISDKTLKDDVDKNQWHLKPGVYHLYFQSQSELDIVVKGNRTVITKKEDVKNFVKNLDFRNQRDFILLEFDVSGSEECKYHVRLGRAKPEFLSELDSKK
eukprot:gene10200-2619_t